MPKATPFLMFQGGNAQAALDLYVATFPGSRMLSVNRFTAGDIGPEGSIKTARFVLCGSEFMCSDSPIEHAFSFTPSSSIFVEFDAAEALDRTFAVLSDGGEVLMPLDDYGFSRRFGWVNDRFGVSWQLSLPLQH
ncbi:VOC family protein [Dyella japonica]|uniref:3-demethylubiquinone-9 3-methyltransferase n=1 Tax=Dyella japonica A8 TaxID=1217721 RepID=A0A075JYY9_9GAMM|nr:VOC family protein [Dyella japonica]AIF47109.1 3-demethylubiquinone-9 3-methyltransferase [Dyella japonica A8]